MSSAAHIGNILRELEKLIDSWPADCMPPTTGAAIGALSMTLRAVTNEYLYAGAITEDEVKGLEAFVNAMGSERVLN